MANFTPQEIEQFLQEFFDVVGTRQYIGARYVPIFGRKDEDSIAWDNSAPYEPLTIVLYQGNSYTSRTYVPTGVDILNQEYWANTGNYNAQVEQYRQEVLQFNSRITDIEDSLPIGDFDDTNTVKDYIDTKYTDGLRIASHGLAFNGRNAIWVCDSWGRPTPAYGVDTPFPNLVTKLLGLNSTILYEGGTGYLNDGSSGNGRYINRITNWVNTHTQEEIEDINYVFVCGSINDYGAGNAELRAAVTAFVNYVNTTFTNAMCVVIPQIGTKSHTHFLQGGGLNPTLFNESPWTHVYTNVFAATLNNNLINYERTLVIPDMFYSLVWSGDSMHTDYVHPNQLGHNIIAEKLAQRLVFGTKPIQVSPVPNVFYSFDNVTSANGTPFTSISAQPMTYNSTYIEGNVLHLNYGFNLTAFEGTPRAIGIEVPGIVPINTPQPKTSGIPWLLGYKTPSNVSLAIDAFVWRIIWQNIPAGYTGENSFILMIPRSGNWVSPASTQQIPLEFSKTIHLGYAN